MMLRCVVLLSAIVWIAGGACGPTPATSGEPQEGGAAGEPASAEPAADEPSPTAGAPAEPAADTPPEGGEPAQADPAGGPTADELAAAAASCTQVSRELPLAEQCAAAGAVVHEFPNTCVGRCKAMEQMMMCGQAFTQGCKCPDGQCIDDETGCCRSVRP